MSALIEVGDTVVSGMECTLPNDRTVFVGRVDGEGTFYIQFTNGRTPTRLKLSPEAFDAMIDLRSGVRGIPVSHLIPHQAVKHWHVVRDETA